MAKDISRKRKWNIRIQFPKISLHKRHERFIKIFLRTWFDLLSRIIIKQTYFKNSNIFEWNLETIFIFLKPKSATTFKHSLPNFVIIYGVNTSKIAPNISILDILFGKLKISASLKKRTISQHPLKRNKAKDFSKSFKILLQLFRDLARIFWFIRRNGKYI